MLFSIVVVKRKESCCTTATERRSDRVGERQALVTQELATLSDSLLKAKADRVAKESLLAQATQANVNTLPAVLQNTLIGHLKEEATKLEARYRELSQSFKPEYPRMQRLAESIADKGLEAVL